MEVKIDTSRIGLSTLITSCKHMVEFLTDLDVLDVAFDPDSAKEVAESKENALFAIKKIRQQLISQENRCFVSNPEKRYRVRFEGVQEVQTKSEYQAKDVVIETADISRDCNWDIEEIDLEE